jgi:hypothetical protein
MMILEKVCSIAVVLGGAVAVCLMGYADWKAWKRNHRKKMFDE